MNIVLQCYTKTTNCPNPQSAKPTPAQPRSILAANELEKIIPLEFWEYAMSQKYQVCSYGFGFCGWFRVCQAELQMFCEQVNQ